MTLLSAVGTTGSWVCCFALLLNFFRRNNGNCEIFILFSFKNVGRFPLSKTLQPHYTTSGNHKFSPFADRQDRRKKKRGGCERGFFFIPRCLFMHVTGAAHPPSMVVFFPPPLPAVAATPPQSAPASG